MLEVEDVAVPVTPVVMGVVDEAAAVAVEAVAATVVAEAAEAVVETTTMTTTRKAAPHPRPSRVFQDVYDNEIDDEYDDELIGSSTIPRCNNNWPKSCKINARKRT